MASDDLFESRRRTEGFLRDARSNLSELAEALCDNEIRAFERNLLHNEFERALDMLDAAYDESGLEGSRVLELMALAAASMGLYERQHRYDDRLSKARGWKYETVIPECGQSWRPRSTQGLTFAVLTTWRPRQRVRNGAPDPRFISPHSSRTSRRCLRR